MFIKTVEVTDELISICLTDSDGEEYVYLRDLENDTIKELKDFSKFGDNGMRLITEDNEYEIVWD